MHSSPGNHYGSKARFARLVSAGGVRVTKHHGTQEDQALLRRFLLSSLGIFLLLCLLSVWLFIAGIAIGWWLIPLQGMTLLAFILGYIRWKKALRQSLTARQPLPGAEPMSEASAVSEFTARLETAFERLRQRYQEGYVQDEFPLEVWNALDTHLLEARQALEVAAGEQRVREFAQEYVSGKITWGQFDRCIDAERDQAMAALLREANALDPQHLLPTLTSTYKESTQLEARPMDSHEEER